MKGFWALKKVARAWRRGRFGSFVGHATNSITCTDEPSKGYESEIRVSLAEQDATNLLFSRLLA